VKAPAGMPVLEKDISKLSVRLTEYTWPRFSIEKSTTMSRNYRSSIPRAAKEVIEVTFENGIKKSAFFFLQRKKVGYREWDEDGKLEFEYEMRNGKKHGREYCFWSGQPSEVTPYRNGLIHGTGTQWADDGTVLITYRLINGTGLDLWCDNQTGTLSEELYWPKNGELGYRRNWNDDETTVNTEYFFNGKGYHGVWRKWYSEGKLRRGFPHYYVNGKRVTKRQYFKASEKDGTLPRYSPEDNQPSRKLPSEYMSQRQKYRV
jgi:antitoxin component YwqK of YwqJK toxin-antitoxin module